MQKRRSKPDDGTDIRRADLAAYDESQGSHAPDRRLQWLQRNQAMVRSFAIRNVESDIVRHLKWQFDTEIGNLPPPRRLPSSATCPKFTTSSYCSLPRT